MRMEMRQCMVMEVRRDLDQEEKRALATFEAVSDRFPGVVHDFRMAMLRELRKTGRRHLTKRFARASRRLWPKTKVALDDFMDYRAVRRFLSRTRSDVTWLKLFEIEGMSREARWRFVSMSKDDELAATSPKQRHLWARAPNGGFVQISDDQHSAERCAEFEKLYAQVGFTEFHYR